MGQSHFGIGWVPLDRDEGLRGPFVCGPRSIRGYPLGRQKEESEKEIVKRSPDGVGGHSHSHGHHTSHGQAAPQAASAPSGYGAAAAPVCRTVYENQCSTINEQVCNTVTDHQCSTVNRQECTTVQDRMCSTSFKEQCSTDSERKCATVIDTVNEQN